ncbi:MAG: hypothetical protein ACRDHE_17790, partial [Ktedonobacterales bacterium]
PSRAAGTGPLQPRAGGLTDAASKTSRQVRKLIWNTSDERDDTSAKSAKGERVSDGAARQEQASAGYGSDDPFPDLDPREALRFRMIRAVLAELPFGDAQCLALHLVAGLNQAEVARALGITGSATRKRVVHGLQLFAQRYEAAAASLRLPPETQRDREDREYKPPLLDHDFARQPPRLGQRPTTHEPDDALTTAPPDLVARVVSANPDERVEDMVQVVLAETIDSYDIANETTIAIYPIVVEADSTLPTPAAERPERPEDAVDAVDAANAVVVAEPPAPAWDEAWAASDVFAVPEPHIAVGSIPLSDTPLALELALEMVDEPLVPPVAGDIGTSEASARATSGRAVDETTPVEPALVSATAPGDALDAEVGDAPGDPLDDATDGIALYDVAEMTRTPLAALEKDAPSNDDAGALIRGASADSGSEVIPGDAVELVHIADVGEPLVVAVSGAETPIHAELSGMPAQSQVVVTPPMVTSAPRGVAEEIAPPREPRRVPVLTLSEAEAAPIQARASARIVPVLSPEASGDDGAVGMVERARVAEPSLR